MKIAIDYRVMSTEAADRGMGRYTQQQLTEVLKLDSENEYLVVLFPGCRKDLIAADVRRAGNVTLKEVGLPRLSTGIHHLADAEILEFSAEFQDWLAGEEIDLYHATTPFVAPVVSDFDATPVVATLYDLIPLVYPRSYFGGIAGRREYFRGLELIARADRVLAISESTRRDALVYLGYDDARCSVAYPAIATSFRPLPKAEVASVLRDLARRVELPMPFVMSVTGIHHSKNARVLLSAHRLLAEAGSAIPLVLVLPTPTAYEAFSAEFDVHEGVTCIQGVSDDEMCALFNAASVVVHPSRYEGFGYPVVEAMSCGTPVITTATSSLVEVGGAAAVLVDPDDVDGLAAAIEAVLGSPERCSEMRARGLEHARGFRGEGLGRTTLGTYEAALDVGNPVGDRERSRVAIWSSLPPLHCGVGDYTAELVQVLATMADVEVFVDDGYLPDPRLTARHTIHHHSAFARRERQRPFDAVVYQMGGTYMQEFMYEALRRRPGVVVLHDLLMGLGFFWIYRGNGKLDSFRRSIVAAEGELAAEQYDRIVSRAKATGQDPSDRLRELFAEHQLLGWIIENSLVQVVHMEEAKLEIEQRYEGAKVSVVDMGVEDPWQGRPRAAANLLRWRYGLSSSFVLGIFGSVVPVKRVEVCLEALALLREEGVDCTLVIVGAQPDPSYLARVNDTSDRLRLGDSVRMYGRVDRDVFDDLLITVDCVLNLRYPSLKGMSAIIIRALAAGKPCVISDVPEWRHLPAECCWPVEPDDREAANIARRVEQLANDAALYESASEEARRFFESRGTLHHMAAQYVEAMEAATAVTAGAPRAEAR